MKKEYIVELFTQERESPLNLMKAGRVSARELDRAHILLMADDQAIDTANALHIGRAAVQRIRKRFPEDGLEQVLNERARPGADRKPDAKQEAFLFATACSDPPIGEDQHLVVNLHVGQVSNTIPGPFNDVCHKMRRLSTSLLSGLLSASCS